MSQRLMPAKIDLGRPFMGTMGSPISQLTAWKDDPESENPTGRRTIMGYVIPDWQRPLVWDESQMISFIESAWRGLPLGTYTYNRDYAGSPYDNLLIDGQQRLYALQCYLEDKFEVFGYRWSEITAVDRRFFSYSTPFSSYIMDSSDEKILREYYTLMNFGGTTHTEDQRA
jgi:hypothetical protein